MTRNVILIIGDPADEKTSLSRRLEARGWAALHVDAIYVPFIRSHVPELFFPRLRDFVAPHYTHIFKASRANDPQSARRDVMSQWHSLLLDAILSASSATPLLAVEGLQLHDCQEELTRGLSPSARVTRVVARDRLYVARQHFAASAPLSVAQVDRLAKGEPPPVPHRSGRTPAVRKRKRSSN